MTCVVGLIQGCEIWMGADTVGIGGLDKRNRKDSKIFELQIGKHKMLIGFTTSFRMGQLLAFNLKNSLKEQGSEDTFDWMVTKFIPAARDVLQAGGYLNTEHGVIKGGTFLVGYRKRLFRVDEDFQVGETYDKYEAVGCGSDLAMGSLFTSTTISNPAVRVRKALKAASHFCAGVNDKINLFAI